MRKRATPQPVRNRANPVQPTPEALDQALAHYADHCATCHANDGSGDTAIGRGVYPRAPDMRGAATQSLTDGELFSIIEHGIRLTAMPGSHPRFLSLPSSCWQRRSGAGLEQRQGVVRVRRPNGRSSGPATRRAYPQ